MRAAPDAGRVGAPAADAGARGCPSGLTFQGECDGTLLRYCDDGRLVEEACADANLGTGACFFLNETLGSVCGQRAGEPCLFSDGQGSSFASFCEAPATGCLIDVAGSRCGVHGACAELEVGGCVSGAYLSACEQAQPRLLDCSSIGATCQPARGCVDVSQGGPCGELLRCAAGLECLGGSCEAPDAGPTPTRCVWQGDLNLILASQAQAFQASGCDEIGGNLIVNNSPVTTLAGLENLRLVRGKVQLAYCRLTTLRALARLQSVGGLEISECNSLSSLDGLQALASTKTLTLLFNQSLSSISALRGLREVGDEIGEESIIIRGVPRLTSLDGLQGITRANYVTVASCPSLTSLAGLENLRTVNLAAEFVELGGESASLPSLETARNMLIRDVDGATQASFPALTSLSTLIVDANDGLRSLEFPQLRLTTSLTVRRNPQLPQCDVDTFRTALMTRGFTGSVSTSGNGTQACP